MGLLVLTLRAPLTRADLPGLCARAQRLVRDSAAEHVICDVSALPAADAVTIDALARVALIVRRRRRAVHVRGASPELCELAALMGVAEVLEGMAPTR
jgi:ABC-type transporter Mla MlaB component